MTDSEPIRFGYTPFPDEVYLLNGLFEEKVDREGYDFDFITAGIDTLNQHSLEGELDVSSISVRAYAELQDQFDILSSGGRFGNRRGPVIATREKLPPDKIKSGTIAVPGKLGTSTLLLKLFAGADIDIEIVPHSLILEQVERGNFTGGVVIDETFLSIEETTLTSSVDLGEWWHKQTELPVPLGVCIVSQSLDNPRAINRIIQRSVQYGLEHPEHTLEKAQETDPGRQTPQLRSFIDQYVNEVSLRMKHPGRRAIQELFNRAYQNGILSDPVNPVFVDQE